MKIAVIGSGIAGMTAANLLSEQHDVWVFEKNNYIGGHTATVDVEVAGEAFAIDTGFIVFNDRTYPNFRALLRKHGVAWQDTQMSFSVQNPTTGLEYNGHNLRTMFAQKRNYLRPSFYKMLFDIVKFNKAAKNALTERSETELANLTLAEFVEELNLGNEFSTNYLYPMCAAIWSASLKEASAFPLSFFLRFFLNHGLLDVANRPQWHVIKGGSRSYIPALTKPFADKITLNADVVSVRRDENGVDIGFADGDTQRFDEVIMACHSDQALALLSDPSAEEQSILGGIPYQKNDVVLHTDIKQLPKRRAAWASWNYLLPKLDITGIQKPATVTYNMNILQGLTDATETFCVTLNNTAAIDPNKILRQFTYDHPVYSVDSFKQRARRLEICGKNRTHFCGAYWYSGFHEDGVRSAVDVAERFGVARPERDPVHADSLKKVDDGN
ncbi:FAD-dependent oxidoreductase [Aliidiomarina iranensis]|uniref:FAD-dependent oxidoreductase n=1 Tax=Aliidiomarina iranensis TaxID=1434071 RepID=A0A432VZZ0_9GAMM|nr:FAD-dependent oxidoreductase [Aliidiomarina iranensis]RUO22305.1 FAD-dependent oxidoreductase [Aliidiomarina iranensis]